MKGASRLQNVVCAVKGDKLEKYLSNLEKCLLISLENMVGLFFFFLKGYEVGLKAYHILFSN